MFKKKSLGQHFLQSSKALGDIAHVADIHPDDIVLEIGPGEGVLTEILIPPAGKVIAVEKDDRLIPLLSEKFKKEIAAGKLDIIHDDILKFDPSVIKFYKHPYKVIANIPYYITGQIIRMFLETEYQPKSMTLLLQKEVAERIVARDGKESLLSLSVKAFGTPQYVRTVGRGAFVPQPNVDSAILHIKDISQERLQGVNPKEFFMLLHAGFAHKRKQLFSNLSDTYAKDALSRAFETCSISPKARAEDISLPTWVSLCENL